VVYNEVILKRRLIFKVARCKICGNEFNLKNDSPVIVCKEPFCVFEMTERIMNKERSKKLKFIRR